MLKTSTNVKREEPIYRRIHLDLQRMIVTKKLKPGDTLPKRSELAGQYKTTQATVNKAFAELSREGLISSKSGRRTLVSPAKSKDISAIAVAWSVPDDLMTNGAEYYGPLFDGIRNACSEHKIDVIFRSSPVSGYAGIVVDTRAQGLLALAPNFADLPELERIHSQGVPIIAVPGVQRATTVPDISSDQRRGIMQAVDHLVGLGHRDIGFLGLTVSVPDHFERMQGFFDAMSAHALPILPNRVRLEALAYPSEFAANVIDWLTLSNLPTAIVTSDFLGSLAVLRRLSALGVSVPKDVSVIQFDDPPAAAHLNPPMTCISQDIPQLGRLGVETLIRRIYGETVDAITIVPTSLIVRESTSAPR